MNGPEDTKHPANNKNHLLIFFGLDWSGFFEKPAIINLQMFTV